MMMNLLKTFCFVSSLLFYHFLIAQDGTFLKEVLKMNTISDDPKGQKNVEIIIDEANPKTEEGKISYPIFVVNSASKPIEIHALGFDVALADNSDDFVIQTKLHSGFLKKEHKQPIVFTEQSFMIFPNSKFYLGEIWVQSNKEKSKKKVHLVNKCGYVKWNLLQDLPIWSEIKSNNPTIKATPKKGYFEKVRLERDKNFFISYAENKTIQDLAFGLKPINVVLQTTDSLNYSMKIETKEADNYKFSIINAVGTLIFTKDISNNTSFEFQFSTKQIWLSGMYSFRIEAKNGNATIGNLITIK